jgi:hypothetical protein
MNPELDEKLCKKYPEIFKQRNISMKETCMCWGFECSDGWFNLIDKLSKKLEEFNKRNFGFIIKAAQVKEKFGTLRFYYDTIFTGEEGENKFGFDPEIAQDIVQNLVTIAEWESEHTCEKCGKRGKIREGGWIMCLCDECNTKK